MGELRNCPICGKVFVKVARNLCPHCLDQEEYEYEEVRKYLKDAPGASVSEISEVTGVNEERLLKWMREGRLEVTLAGGELTCRSCGARITAGNLCARCAHELAARIKSMSGTTHTQSGGTDKAKAPNSRGMFVADRLKEDS